MCVSVICHSTLDSKSISPPTFLYICFGPEIHSMLFPTVVSDRMVPPTRFSYKVLLAYSVCLFVGPLLCYQLLGRRVQ